MSARNPLSLGGLFPDPEDQQIFAVLSNYLMLSQFDVAQKVIDELFTLDPERIIRLFRVMFNEEIPATWLLSKSSPSVASLVWFCAQEYERLGQFIQQNVVGKVHPLSEKITNINSLGFVDHDQITIDVIEGRNLQVPEDHGVSVVVTLGHEKFQTHISNIPFAKLPQWAGYYAVADNSHRSPCNQLSVRYADSEAHFEVLATPLVQGAAARPGDLQAVGAPVTLAVGTVSLATLRDQDEYNILVTLKAPTAADDDAEPLTVGADDADDAAGAAAGNDKSNNDETGSASLASLAALSRTDSGRLKVALRWGCSLRLQQQLLTSSSSSSSASSASASSEPCIGALPASVRARLQADCALSAALLNAHHRGAGEQALLSDQVLAELRAKFATTPEDVAFAVKQAQALYAPNTAKSATATTTVVVTTPGDVPQQPQQQEKKTEPTARLSAAAKLAASIQYPFPELAGAQQPTWAAHSVFVLSDACVRELEALCRTLPATGHTLTSLLAEHMRRILPPPSLAGRTAPELTVALQEQLALLATPPKSKSVGAALTDLAVNVTAVGSLVVLPLLSSGTQSNLAPTPLSETDLLRLRMWAAESQKLQEVYLQQVSEALIHRRWDACLDALTHFLSVHAANLTPSSPGRALSSLLLLLSHAAYYEAENAASVALPEIRAIVRGLVAERPAPTAELREEVVLSKMTPDYMMSLLVLVFYLRHSNTHLTQAAAEEDSDEDGQPVPKARQATAEILDANRPVVINFIESFVHSQYANAPQGEREAVIARVLQDVLRLLEPTDRHSVQPSHHHQQASAADSGHRFALTSPSGAAAAGDLRSAFVLSLHRLSASSPEFQAPFDDQERGVHESVVSRDAEAPFRHPFLRKAQVIGSLLASQPEGRMAAALMQRLDAEMAKVHLIANITEQDTLPFFFHQFDLALESIDAAVENMQLDDAELRSLSDDQRLEHEKALLNKALAAFLMEYHAFLRATQYGFYDFPLCQALKFISAGRLIDAHLVLLPFPQLRPLAIVLAVFRAQQFSAQYNILVQLWDSRYVFPAMPLPTLGDPQLEAATPVDMLQCSEPALEAWCNRLNYWVEMIEQVRPRQLLTEEDQANATPEQLGEDARLEQEKTEAMVRLCNENASLFTVLGWYMLNLPASTYIEMFETSPYYMKLGPQSNHDMLLLRMVQALFTTFNLIYQGDVSANGSDYLSHTLDNIDTIINHGMADHLNYQVATLEKMFCLVLLRRELVFGAEESFKQAAASLSTLLSMFVFIKHVADALIEQHELASAAAGTTPSPLLKRLRRLQMHLDDYHWRAQILHGQGIGSERYLGALGTSLRDLHPVLLHRSRCDEPAEIDDEDNTQPLNPAHELQWQRTRTAWLNGKRNAAAAGVAGSAQAAKNEARAVEALLRALTPADMNSFTFIVDLALSNVADAELFASGQVAQLARVARPYLIHSPLAHGQDAHGRLMLDFWQSYLESLSLSQQNKFHIAAQLLRPEVAQAPSGSALSDMLAAFRTKAKRSPDYVRILEMILKKPDADRSPWLTDFVLDFFKSVSGDADKSVLRASLPDLLFPSSSSSSLSASALSRAAAAAASTRRSVVSASTAVSTSVALSRTRSRTSSQAASQSASEAGSTVSKKAAYAERRAREREAKAQKEKEAALVQQQVASLSASVPLHPGDAIDVSSVSDTQLLQVVRARHATAMSVVMPLLATLRFSLLQRLPGIANPAQSAEQVDRFAALVSEAATCVSDIADLLPELSRWGQQRVDKLQLVLTVLRRFPSPSVQELRPVLDAFLLDQPERDTEAVLLLVRYMFDRHQNMDDLQAALDALDAHTDTHTLTTAGQVLCEELLHGLLGDAVLTPERRLALVMRLRDPVSMAEYMVQHLRTWLEPRSLMLLLQKVLHGNLTRSSELNPLLAATPLPPVVQGLATISWPPVTPVATKQKTLFEYTLGLLHIFVELGDAEQGGDAELLAAFALNWPAFEERVDADFLAAVRYFCEHRQHRAMQKLLGLYRATKTKAPLMAVTRTFTTAAGIEETISVSDEAQRDIDLASLADLLSSRGTARDRLNVVKQLELVAKYEPAKLLTHTRTLVDKIAVLSVRLLLLEFLHTRILADRADAAQRERQPSIPVAEVEWVWVCAALAACRLLQRFPVDWQARFLHHYADPSAMARALILESGRTKTQLPALLSALADPALRPQVSVTVLDLVVGICTRRSAEETLCGRSLAFLLLETGADDAEATALSVLTAVDAMSRTCALVDVTGGVLLRDNMLDLLAWLVSKYPATTPLIASSSSSSSSSASSSSSNVVPEFLRVRVLLYNRLLRDSRSLFYQLCSLGNVEFSLLDLFDRARARELRTRLFQYDQPQLAKRVLVEIERFLDAEALYQKTVSSAQKQADSTII